MDAIYLLIFMGGIVAFGFLVIFIIAVKKGQFDDSTTPGIRMLFDTEVKEDNTNKEVK